MTSRKVQGYLKALSRYHKARVKYRAKADALVPFQQALDLAKRDMMVRFAQLNGGQIAEARRLILKSPLADQELIGG